MSLNKLAREIHKIAVDKGFWEGKRNISECLMLVVTELGEACEALRKDNKQEGKQEWMKHTYEDELADALIRILDLCAAQKIDIDWQVKNKLDYNKTREYKHGKKF